MITCVALVNLAQVALAEGRVEECENHLAEGVSVTAAMGTYVNMEICLALLAVASAEQHRWRRAAILLGAAAGMRAMLGAPIHDSYLFDSRILKQTNKAVREALGGDAYQHATLIGSRMDLEDAAAFVSASFTADSADDATAESTAGA